jgi:uncharacterized protein (DUF1501 family)
MLIRSRREFMKATLQSVGALGALGSLGKFGEMNALAAAVNSNYRALVCIFLAGGNDGHNMVVPIAVPSVGEGYSLYFQSRQTLALAQGSLQTIQNGGDTYGLHPNMPEMAALYNAGNAAIVANVGTLVKPISRTTYLQNNQADFPTQLYSHADQVNQWQTTVPNGSAFTGWGGLAEDTLAAQNAGAAFSPVTSTSGCGLFCTGQNTYASTIPVGGASNLVGATTGNRIAAYQNMLAFDNGLKLVQAANTIFNRGVGFSKALTAALAAAKINTAFPVSVLGQQLLTVAKVISIQATLGINRQVFFCQLGGFDTHGAQIGNQDPLLQDLSRSVSAFYTCLSQELGADKDVVSFTASEFGRTLQPNSTAGTDHAWGSHHFLIGTGASSGGSLRGGQFFGQFPSLALGGDNDANGRGTLIPTTSVEQYAATIATWFGVTANNLPSVVPYIGNFPTANLGFLG